MRARDARAIAFCAVTSVALFIGCLALLKNPVAALALGAAYLSVVLTRPRMLRVMRRLRGEPDWGGYYKDN